MSLLPNDAQPNAAPQDDGLEAYAPTARSSRGSKSSGSAPEAASASPAFAAKEDAGGGGLNLSGLRVSLMPSELEGKAPPDLGRGLMIMALVLIVETIIIGTAYFFTARAVDARIARQGELQAEIDALDKAVAAQEEAAKEAASYNGQVNAAKEALDTHLYWTKFFALLEAKTRQTVKYLNFSGDAETGTVTLDAIGRTYRDVAEQIVALREDKSVADVRTTSAAAQITDTGEVTGVSFTMVIRFKPEAWTRSADEVAPAAVAAKDCGTSNAPEPSTSVATGSLAPDDDAYRCFADQLARCELASLTIGQTGSTVAKYDILGSGRGGCLVRQAYIDGGNPTYDGKTMTCPFDPSRTLTDNVKSRASYAFADCTGTLVPLMKAAAAAAEEAASIEE